MGVVSADQLSYIEQRNAQFSIIDHSIDIVILGGVVITSTRFAVGSLQVYQSHRTASGM